MRQKLEPPAASTVEVRVPEHLSVDERCRRGVDAEGRPALASPGPRTSWASFRAGLSSLPQPQQGQRPRWKVHMQQTAPKRGFSKLQLLRGSGSAAGWAAGPAGHLFCGSGWGCPASSDT
ncbi:unnamed protein product [Rangifer tarandus platyrhynchus]|uniref:Uncharacterized protein n=1 Tax=Rangifer tarandus platyrhynchus TaxID=3082113 RepID=A0AC59YJN2_RANTA